ncbi:PREDICTED: ras-like GTP-binding protein rhoA [Amphimedon queenslandica]|uniref:Uncharacterized protein n=1 Tax=Amphimedon queenslandica TaxID=400682 RepID=A0A1X7VWD7_AMPQE|nr:PREDICTED: ras-like GTP-binding protein rhoA [Amphimedon queenslandica]|eukprot:XP_019849696.1 PREDICTED: ras-like GTP-binding protein rhoA [Amphimedon queenslandica]
MIRAEGVVVGNYGVGKTSFLYAILNKQIPDKHVPTILESHCMTVKVKDDVDVELVFHDTPGSEDYAQFTQLSLARKADFVLLCFSLVIPASFDSIRNHWINEIRSKLPNVPVVLIGTQLDLRNKPEVVEDLVDCGTPAIDTETGQKLADEIGAIKYIECSAFIPTDTDKIKLAATQIAYECKKKNKKDKCVIL